MNVPTIDSRDLMKKGLKRHDRVDVPVVVCGIGRPDLTKKGLAFDRPLLSPSKDLSRSRRRTLGRRKEGEDTCPERVEGSRHDLVKWGLKQLNQRYVVDFHLAVGSLDLTKEGIER